MDLRSTVLIVVSACASATPDARRVERGGVLVVDATGGSSTEGLRVHLARSIDEGFVLNGFAQLAAWTPRDGAAIVRAGRADVRVPAEGTYWILAAREGRVLGSVGPMHLDAGALTGSVRVDIRGTGRLEGRVLEHDGRPAAHVLVAAAPRLGLPWYVRTDVDGRYAFDGLPAEPYLVVREHDVDTSAVECARVELGLASASQRKAPPTNVVVAPGATTSFDLALEEPGRLVVRIDGRPRSGDRVDLAVSTTRLGSRFSGRVLPSASPDGAWSFTLPRPGRMKPWIEARLGTETFFATRTEAPIEHGTVELVLQGTHVEGRLSPPFRSGESIGAFNHTDGWRLSFETTCDAEGRFAFPFVPGTWLTASRGDASRVVEWTPGDVVRVDDL